MKQASPYLYFNGNTEEAFRFYRSVFGGEYLGVLRYRDFPDNAMGVSEDELDRIAHIGIPLGEGNMLMGSDTVGSGTREFAAGNNVYIMLDTDSSDEADRVFSGLADGGTVVMPPDRTEWAEKYGIVVGRFGVQWMVNYTGDVEFSAPGGS